MTTTAIVLLALLAAAPIRSQSQSAASGAAAQAQPQIIRQVEAEAEAYKAAIAEMPIDVQQTVRYFDASGHLKSTLRTSYRYTLAADDPASAKPKRGAPAAQTEQSAGALLSDGVTLPLLFLPGSVIHLALSADTPPTGPWILHFKSTPCGPPQVRRHWMHANVVSQCVEGEAYLDPANDSITRIRMRVGGLPVGFRTLAYPMGVIVVNLSNEASFALLNTSPGEPPRLVPEKAEYATYTTHGRTIIDQTYELPPARPRAPASPR